MTVRKDWSETRPFDPLVQAGIDAAMRDIVKHGSPKQSTSILPPLPEPPTQKGTGWKDEKALHFVEKGSREDKLIDAMVAAKIGGPNDPLK